MIEMMRFCKKIVHSLWQPDCFLPICKLFLQTEKVANFLIPWVELNVVTYERFQYFLIVSE
jgi:hypothetical protein